MHMIRDFITKEIFYFMAQCIVKLHKKKEKKREKEIKNKFSKCCRSVTTIITIYNIIILFLNIIAN